MKVILAVHHLPPNYDGGAELRAIRTAIALQRRDVQVQLICIERVDEGNTPGVTWQDETFAGLPVRRLYYNLAYAPDRFRWEYDNPWIGDHLAELFQEGRPDVFHLIGGYLMTSSALKASHNAGVSSVVTLTDFWYLCPRIQMLRSDGRRSSLPIDPFTCARCLGEQQRRYRYPGKAFPWLMSAYWRSQKKQADRVSQRLDTLLGVLNQVDVIISPSQFLRSVYVQAGVMPERILFSRQGRDFAELQHSRLQKKPANTLRVGYIGQISEHKGVHVLVEALQAIPDLPLEVSIFGNPAPFQEYSTKLQEVAARDKRLSFAGSFQRQELSQVMQELDIIVVPSLWYENSPNVILEAFAHHTPVVASDLGGMAEMVLHEKNGLLFPPGDSGALVDIFHRLVNEPGLVRRLANGIEPVRTVDQEMAELQQIYTTLVAGSLSSQNGSLASPVVNHLL